jgi:hypothetical protein
MRNEEVWREKGYQCFDREIYDGSVAQFGVEGLWSGGEQVLAEKREIMRGRNWREAETAVYCCQSKARQFA